MRTHAMWNQDLVQKALDFAACKHGIQEVPGKGYSYTVHITGVCMEVMRAICESPAEKPDLAILCALLHDVLEDTDASDAELESVFGPDVLRGVKALTKNASLKKEEKTADSLDRIKRQPPEIGMVKLADRITNLQEPPASWTKEKIRSYLEEARLIHRELHHCSVYLAGRLEEKIREYARYIV